MMAHNVEDNAELYNGTDSKQKHVVKDTDAKKYDISTGSADCQLDCSKRRNFEADCQLSENSLKSGDASNQKTFSQVSPIDLRCCRSLSKIVLHEKHFKETISQWSEFGKNSFMRVVVDIGTQQRQKIIPFIFGILVGVTLTALLFQQHILYASTIPWTINGAKQLINQGFKHSPINPELHKHIGIKKDLSFISLRETQENMFPVKSSLFPSGAKGGNVFKTKLFVGVITAEKFLPTRALAVNNTWGGQVDKIEFFTQHGSREKYGIPVVNLEKVSDQEYPPQKKAFEMLKHMCTHHINDFEWFIRADDDVYIRVKRLKQFLTQIDSRLMIYMGQPGHGVPEVRQKLGLNGHNFCMGGPGVIFNRKALSALCPHIDDCMRDVLSKEEDVEIGRCVTKHLHIECTHAWETLKLFYHSYQEEYTEEKPFLGNLAENEHVNYALTLHHLKLPYIMYRVHRHYSSLLLNSTVQTLNSIQTSLQQTNSMLPLGQQHHLSVDKPVIAPFKPRRLKDVNTWKSFGTESVYSASPAHIMHDITNDVLGDLKQIGETGIDEAIGHAEVQKFTYSHVSDGYLRSDATRGTDYLLDIYFNSKKPEISDEIRRVHLLRPLGEMEVTGIRQPPAVPTNGKKYPFYVIVAISLSEAAEFESFMRNYYEPVFLAGSQIAQARLVVVFGSTDVGNEAVEESSMKQDPYETVSQYSVKYKDAEITTLPKLPGTSSAQEAYAQGIIFVYKHVFEMDRAHLTGTVVLLTSPNISLSSDVKANCISRTGAPSGSNAYNDDTNYNFINYKSRKKNVDRPIAQIYQPIPFHIYPAAVDAIPRSFISDARDSKLSAGKIRSLKVDYDNGFWDNSAALGEDDNTVTAPLCGRLSDLYKAASSRLTSLNSTESKVTFRYALYEQVYAGKLTVLRFPDHSFLYIPRR